MSGKETWIYYDHKDGEIPCVWYDDGKYFKARVEKWVMMDDNYPKDYDDKGGQWDEDDWETSGAKSLTGAFAAGALLYSSFYV